MNMFLTLAFLFFIGSVSGWVMELLYRHYLAPENSERKWINPGFCTGPYLPLYGCGLCIMYLIACLEKYIFASNPALSKTVLLLVIAICMTAIEYLAGIMNLKVTKVRLWDYSNEWGNVQGIICPKFSALWAILGAVYYFLIHPHIIGAIYWLSDNLAFSFVIGLFFGIFIIDAAQSVHLVAKLKEYAEENEVIIRYETIKSHIRTRNEEIRARYHFFRPFRSDISLREHVAQLKDTFEKRKNNKR